MKKIPFKKSKALSLGVELEFQIIDPITFDLVSQAKELIRSIHSYQKTIKPEITQSMIEINSSVHETSQELLTELLEMKSFLLYQGNKIGTLFAGGGTHPFQLWTLQKIFPTKRFINLSRHFRYLSKRSTVFGQHVHIGCTNADDALYLTHALGRYVPQLLAISASSPFYQGVDTGFHSSRSTIFTGFPQSGFLPYLLNWDEFSKYFYKLRKLGIVKTMKDFYWDIRPKPEFGTVEVRVCDTPLTIKKAVNIAAYIQALSAYILDKRPIEINHNLYYLYNYNRFQASRYAYEADFIDPMTLTHIELYDDILTTIKTIKKYAVSLGSSKYLAELSSQVLKKQNDAVYLRQMEKEHHSLPFVVSEQCRLWNQY